MSASDVPVSMRAKCENCGARYSGGTVSVWLKRDADGITNEPREDVSFRCLRGCDEVQNMDVKILKRAGDR